MGMSLIHPPPIIFSLDKYYIYIYSSISWTSIFHLVDISVSPLLVNTSYHKNNHKSSILKTYIIH